MNYYSFSPLIAFFVNLLLGVYIFYRDPKSRLNILYSLFEFSVAIWALGTFLSSVSLTSGGAMYWDKLTVTGSLLLPAFLLHFFSISVKSEFASRKGFYMPLYLPALFFILVNLTTNLIKGTATPSLWGYKFASGILYIPVAFYIIVYFVAGILLCCRSCLKTKSAKEKIQMKFLIISAIIPLVGGTITEAIPSIIGFEMIPLSTIFMTISAIIIAYTIMRYKLMTPMLFRIQKKLVTVMLLVSLVIALSMLVVADAASKANMEGQVKNTLESIIGSRASHVKEFLSRYIEGLNLVSSRTQLRLSLDSYNKYGKMEDKEKMRTILNDAKNSISDFKDILILNLDGEVVVSTDKDLENENYLDEDFFAEGKEDNNVFFIFDENNEPSFRLSGPLLLDEEVIGVVVIISKAGALFEMFSDYTGMGETGELYLIDKNMRMITPSRLEGYAPKKIVDTENARDCFLHANWSVEKTEKYHETRVYKDYRNINVLGTYAYIPEMGWCLLAEIDEEEAFASHLNLQRNLILIAVIFAIFSLVISVLVSRSITRPIIKLRDAVSEIGKGELDTKIEVKSNDEIGELTSAFNQMTIDLKESRKKLKEYSKSLEKQVTERTKEVERSKKKLESKVDELEKFSKLAVGRELKMIELKKGIKELEEKLEEK
jgi:methyl-accepting chemotaxis protein